MALLGAGLTASLGVWQLQRAQQKEAITAHWQQQQALAQLVGEDLIQLKSADPARLGEWHDRHVMVRGRWLPRHTVFLDNRQMESRQGFFVLTPFALDLPGASAPQVVLVQRGWIPRHFLQRELLPSIQTPTTLVSFRGRLAASPSRVFEFKGADTGKIRQNTGVAELGLETGLSFLPLILVQTEPNVEGSDDPQLLRNWAPPAAGVEKHYGYAVQWFLLSALITGLFVWFQIIAPSRRRRLSRA